MDQNPSAGFHKLIRDVATLMTSVDDLLDELNYLDGLRPQPVGEKPAEKAAGRPANLSADEARVFECSRGGAILTPDTITAQTGLSAAELSSTLRMLELKRLIAKRADGAFEARG